MTKIIICLFLTICLASCTYNVSMAHTSGTAEDVIDDTASNTPSTSASLNPSSNSATPSFLGPR